MKLKKDDLINAQTMRADEAFKMAGLAIKAQLWNSAASELYYTRFYLIQSLFFLHGMEAKTHSGVKALFSLKFIKDNYLENSYGKLFARLFNYRQEGNYGSYTLTAI